MVCLELWAGPVELAGGRLTFVLYGGIFDGFTASRWLQCQAYQKHLEDRLVTQLSDATYLATQEFWWFQAHKTQFRGLLSTAPLSTAALKTLSAHHVLEPSGWRILADWRTCKRPLQCLFAHEIVPRPGASKLEAAFADKLEA